MPKITSLEVGTFLRLFVRRGYVLDFSTSDFDVFTQQSIGVALCNRYGMSKGKSLTTYANEADDKDVIKLLDDLLTYYESGYKHEIEYDEEVSYDPSGEYKMYQKYYRECRGVMDKIKLNTTPFSTASEVLKDKFGNDYISSQIDLMQKMQNPTEAIGKAKEFIESCCKTIFEKCGLSYDKDWTVSKAVKETMKILKIETENVDASTAEGKTIRAILGNLHGIAGNIAELRNQYGSGHGKSSSFKGLELRHAKLAVGSSITLVNYLWDTYEWRKDSGRI